jgi:hypothetical protein
MGMAVRTELTPDELRNQIQRQTELRKIMTDYVKGQMIEGHHYYYFNKLGKQGQTEAGGPRDDKPALTQEGAYQILSLFRCITGVAKNEIIRHPDGHFTVVSEVPVFNGEGVQISTGNGSCTTRESKYAYRKGERECPECGQPKINKSKFPPKNAPPGTQPGWYCYAKIGGCGAEFEANDPRIKEQVVGRVENPDLADLENTVLKMSVKRATVAATRKLSLVSELFATDPEGAEPEHNSQTPASTKKASGSRSTSTSSAPPSASSAAPSIVDTAVNLSTKLQKDYGMSFDDLAVQFLPEDVAKFSDLTPEQASGVVPGLSELLNSKVAEARQAA